MINATACRKQEPPNQRFKPELSKTNLLFFTKKSFILQIKSINTYIQTRPYFCLCGRMVEYSFMN